MRHYSISWHGPCTGYVDKSRRKPYICGKCGRDITHPCHQPTLQGFTAATPNRAEVAEDPIPEPKPQRRQLALFEVNQ